MQTNRIKSSSADRNYSIYYWLMKDLLKSKIFNMVSILFLVARLKTQSNRFLWWTNNSRRTLKTMESIDILFLSFFNSLKSYLWWKIKANGNKIEGFFSIVTTMYTTTLLLFFVHGLQSFIREKMGREGNKTWKLVKSNVFFSSSQRHRTSFICVHFILVSIIYISHGGINNIVIY